MTLELDGIEKSYDGFQLGPVDLTVGREVLSVLGPSGCGKTTLLWSIAGLLPVDAGSISLNDRALNERPPEDRRTGLVFQDGALFPNLTARDNIAYACGDSDRVEGLAETFEIEDVLDRHPPTLSGGERQRVALARTLATDPEALLLDEPLSSLDAPIRRRLRTELADLFESLAIPVVLVTHNQRTATTLGDQVAVLNNGHVVQIGTPSEVLARPNSEFVARFTGTENIIEAVVTSRDGEMIELRVGDVSLYARGNGAVDTVVSACIHPTRVQLRTNAGDEATRRRNTLSGRVHRWLNEGDGYRVEIGIPEGGFVLVATVSPPLFEQLSLSSGSEIIVRILPKDIHLL